MSAVPICVVKVGCSLFERPQLPSDLLHWLRQQPPALHILLTGAGELAETIHNWQPHFRLSDAASHWLCIDLLSVTAKILHQGLSDFALLTTFAELQAAIVNANDTQQSSTIIFDVQQFLRETEPTLPSEPLPHNWDVSSDSIAARLAEVIAADELILLKSKACPEDHCGEQTDFTALVAGHYVDHYFPTLVPRVRKIRLCQLPPAALEN